MSAALVAGPALAALIGFLLPYRARRMAAIVGCAGGMVVFVAAVIAFFAQSADRISQTVATFGSLTLRLQLHLTTTASIVAILVGAVALAVQVYSVKYLANDSRYVPYVAQVSLFVTAMLAVVCADDLITLLIGWEVMGLCSYLLIGHDTSLPEAPRAAVKAFLVTRVGDIGFLLGIIVLGVGAGSFAIPDVLKAITDGTYTSTELTAAGLLLFAGVAGKSAQFPLHTWLPDAMAGPTPISALIHAATMVAAGVYVLITLRPIFVASSTTLLVIAAAGAITVLIGALAACVVDDIKRVLAYSTMSHLGYLVAILGLPGIVRPAALFHLLSHGVFKALLFLSAGAVIHAAGTNSMAAMGGLRRAMPVTFICMTAGLASAAGLPPFGGFWSKESVIGAAMHGFGDGTAGVVVAVSLWVSVPLTAWYCTRLFLRVFFGPSQTHRPAKQQHQGDPAMSMRVPLIALAAATCLVGVLAFTSRSLVEGWSADTIRPHADTTVLVVLLTILGCLTTWWAWRSDRTLDPARIFGILRPPLQAGFYVDAIQDAVIVRPAHRLSRLVRRADEQGVDGVVEGAGNSSWRLGGVLDLAHTGLARYAAIVVSGGLCLGLVTLAMWELAT